MSRALGIYREPEFSPGKVEADAAILDATMAELLGTYRPDLAVDERARLVTLAEGSPGRALLLAEEDGLKIAGLVEEVLAALPDLPATRAARDSTRSAASLR